jgi:hypothetical protein
MSHLVTPDVTSCLRLNYTEWVNSPLTFDNVWAAYLSLFQGSQSFLLVDYLYLFSPNDSVVPCRRRNGTGVGHA